MKKIILGLLVGLVMTGSAFANCTYDMNGTDPSASAFPSVVNQKGTFSIKPTTTQLDYQAMNSNFNPNSPTLTGDIQLISSGITAFEFKTEVIPTDLPGTESIMQGYSFIGFDANNKMHALSLGYSNNTAVQNYKELLYYYKVDQLVVLVQQ